MVNGESQPAASPAEETVAAEGSGGEIAVSAEMVAAGGDAPVATEAAAAAPASPETTAQEPNSTAELKFEEIWRPRRQGRHHERERGRRRSGPPPSVEPAKDANKADKGETRESSPQRRGKEARDDRQARDGQPKRHDRNDRKDRHDRSDRKDRRQGPNRREDQQPRVFRHSASPAPKPGIDPDSPFAALSSLKAALEKQSQE